MRPSNPKNTKNPAAEDPIHEGFGFARDFGTIRDFGADVARAVVYLLAEPEGVDVSELVIRPVGPEL